MNLNPTIQASSPIVLQILDVNCQLPKNRYVSYYEVPTQLNCFKSVDHLQQITLISKTLRFKILDLQSPQSLPFYANATVTMVSEDKVKIELAIDQGIINIQGKIINKSDNSGTVYALSIADLTGYNGFIGFRRKYKTLQNVTRKQTFELDHRLKVVAEGVSPFYFSMEESDQSKHFFSHQKISLYLEEIFRVGDYQTIEIIHEEQLNLDGLQTCANALINILQKLKITIDIELIKNSNFTKSQIASLRVLQVNSQVDSITAGTDKFRKMVTMNRLQDSFFDYQYAYLNKNVKQLQGTSVYDFIDKLTPSFPNYPHFINSKIIHIGASRMLVFEVGNQEISLPFVYILKGLNILETQDINIKFYIDFKDGAVLTSEPKRGDERRFIQLSLIDIWNLGLIAAKCSDFELKIITDNTIYAIPFHRSEIDRASFKKEAKQLDIKQQYAEFNQNKYYLLSKTNKNDKLYITKTENINDFYLLDLSTSSSVYFQISTPKQIKVQGIVERDHLLNTKQLQVILSSPDNNTKVIVFGTISQIKQNNSGLRIFYKIMQRLQFTDQTPCDDVRYSLQLKRLSDNKKIKAKISPEMQSDGISTLVGMQQGFFNPTSPQLQLLLSLRKMFYDEQTQVYDNDEILDKKIIVNASADKILEKNCFFLNIDKEGYTAIDFDFYDSNIKKKMKLYLEFVVRKNPFFDATGGSYKIKIPPYLWKFNHGIGNSPQIVMESHLSHKNKRGAKICLFPDSPQEYSLPFYNYKDGISVRVNQNVGYEKVMDAVKLKCDIVKNNLGWVNESQWSLAIINIGKDAFHFLISYVLDGMAVMSDDDSVRSGKTAGKNKSERSYGEKIDPFAKTVKNMDLFNLKKMRNDVVNQGRKLTAKYIKCQQTVTNLTKKIQQVDQLTSKRIKHQKEILSNPDQPTKNSSTKLTQFYRSICQCGTKNPKYNGYCEQCLKKMKKKYEIYLKEYNQKSYTYEKIYFDKFNNKEKLIRIKNKIETYKEKLRSGQNIEDNDVNEVVKNLQEMELKRLIQSLKIDIFTLKQQQDTIQQSAKKRQQAIELQIKKEDDQILANIQHLDMLNNQVEDLQQQLNSIQ